VLDGGRHKARVAARKAEMDFSEARYRETVLGALRDVNNHLQAYGNCKTILAQASEQEQSASALFSAARVRATHGTISKLALIEAEATRFERSSGRLLVQLGCYRGSVDVLLSLGGAL
jgi:outer membrane protein TolC